MFVQVAVNIPQVSGIFDYHLPPEMESRVSPGCLVIVPFGRQMVQGIVLKTMAASEIQETRAVEALVDEQPVLTAALLALGSWISKQTLTPLGTCLDRMLPSGISQHSDTLYSLNPAPETQDPYSPNAFQQRLIDLFQRRGDLRGRQVEAAFSHQNWKPAMQDLVRRGLVLSKPVLPPPTVHPKMVRTVQLACRPEELEAQISTLGNDLGRGAARERREAVLRYLAREPWPVLVSWAYASSGCTLPDLQKLAEEDLVVLGESEIWRDPLEEMDIQPTQAPVLTPAQTGVIACLRPFLLPDRPEQAPTPFLLYGVTGSGKTEIYLQAVEETLRSGRQAIILVPEIALTPQTLRRFASRFPGQVGVVHSRLSAGERYDTWRRARAGQLSVIVGPRSALFTPLQNLGLIVVDECHDDSYYHAEGLYSFHAVRAAIAYSQLTRCPIILGSATPPVDIMYQASRQNWKVLKLSDRVYAGMASSENGGDSLPLPAVEIVDMRQELKAGNRSIFSRALQQALGQTLDANQQAILYLNRRGSATYVFCRDCGHSLNCPRCSLPLTYHLDAGNVPAAAVHLPGTTGKAGLLICHQCGYTRQMPRKCPECGGVHIRQYGAGTEKVESEVAALFPQARVLRWDAETTRHKGAHEILLSHFSRHQADILIGTQMLAKGLDLPLVTLVGAVLADVGLNFPDFRTAERTFQLLTQVAGRAGRGPLGGKAIFQTFQPEHPAILAAAGHDYDGFYQRELEQRRRLGYPPFTRMARIEVRDTVSERAEATARARAARVQHCIDTDGHTSTQIIGPVPCFFARFDGEYRWQFILRGPDPIQILRKLNLEDSRIEIDPPNLL